MSITAGTFHNSTSPFLDAGASEEPPVDRFLQHQATYRPRSVPRGSFHALSEKPKRSRRVLGIIGGVRRSESVWSGTASAEDPGDYELSSAACGLS